VRTVLGADVSYAKQTDRCYAAAVLWDRRRREVVSEATAVRRARFPYVPGLLSFREAPALLAAFARLAAEPDLLIIEGQGLAHPRRFGLASHVGLLFDRPTVGCAKSRLLGHHASPGRSRGARAGLRDGGEIVGSVLRTREGVRPLFVSVGHAVTLDQACRLVLDLCSCYRQPDVLRRAHALANERRRAAGDGPDG
jgi:deoxyribonuclease V